MKFKSIGKIIYNPRTHLGSNEKWAILSCDDEIQKYYRLLYEKQYPYLNGDLSGRISRSVWGAHISAIRGEKIPNMNLWGLENNKIVEFEYEAGVLDNNDYYWLRVKCPFLSDLREKYGLYREPRFGFHLTVGKATK